MWMIMMSHKEELVAAREGDAKCLVGHLKTMNEELEKIDEVVGK